MLSHGCAAALWKIKRWDGQTIHVMVPRERRLRRPGIVVHRCGFSSTDTTTRLGIPVSTPATTIIDIAPSLSEKRLTRAINEADKLGLINPEKLRTEAARLSTRPGAFLVAELLDEATFVATDSELERLFLPIARKVGLPTPETGAVINGFKVDFWWPDLGLVVETDGLRYHRTALQQAADRRRDQIHMAAGLMPLRFTHAQVARRPWEVEETLTT